jgi:ankyrin repeat protein
MNATLLSAIRSSNIKAVEKCIMFGYGINDNDALILSSNYNNVDIIKLLVANGANPRCDNDICLLNAITSGNIDVVKFFYIAGCQINGNALYRASRGGYLAIVKYLVSTGYNFDKKDRSAIRAAAEFGHFETVKYLISIGCNKMSALSQSIVSNQIKLVKFLAKDGINWSGMSYNMLCVIVQSGTDILEYLVEKGFPVSFVPENKLDHCAVNGYISSVSDYLLCSIRNEIRRVSAMACMMTTIDIEELFVAGQLKSILKDFLTKDTHRQIIKTMLQLGCSLNGEFYFPIRYYLHFGDLEMVHLFYAYLSPKDKFKLFDPTESAKYVHDNVQIALAKSSNELFRNDFTKGIILKQNRSKINFLKCILRPKSLKMQSYFI